MQLNASMGPGAAGAMGDGEVLHLHELGALFGAAGI